MLLNRRDMLRDSLLMFCLNFDLRINAFAFIRVKVCYSYLIPRIFASDSRMIFTRTCARSLHVSLPSTLTCLSHTRHQITAYDYIDNRQLIKIDTNSTNVSFER
jgi:hypothetical protein